MRQHGLTLAAGDTKEKEDSLLKALMIVLPPRDQSDRTCFRRICEWATSGVTAGVFDEWEIYRRILGYALDATQPKARNPRALFLSILKKEMKYKPGQKGE
jgi:hypothetical protein